MRLKRNLTQPEVARIEESSAELPGVHIRVEPLRWYPHGKLAAHVLGYVGDIDATEYLRKRSIGYEADDVVGQSGVEARHDTLLHGHHGFRFVEVDAFGRATTFSGPGEPQPSTAGSGMVLTRV